MGTHTTPDYIFSGSQILLLQIGMILKTLKRCMISVIGLVPGLEMRILGG